jgi:DNA invertase Pin-like site-specific DNA recombinase
MVGLRRARQLGHKGGGKPLLSEKRQERVIKQIASGEMTQSEAAKEEGVSKSTICRIMAKVQEKEQKKMGLDTALA